MAGSADLLPSTCRTHLQNWSMTDECNTARSASNPEDDGWSIDFERRVITIADENRTRASVLAEAGAVLEIARESRGLPPMADFDDQNEWTVLRRS